MQHRYGAIKTYRPFVSLKGICRTDADLIHPDVAEQNFRLNASLVWHVASGWALASPIATPRGFTWARHSVFINSGMRMSSWIYLIIISCLNKHGLLFICWVYFLLLKKIIFDLYLSQSFTVLQTIYRSKKCWFIDGYLHHVHYIK